ncbi:oligosaccharide repeat unit polymerase [Bacteroides sp. 51]|uniref:oligosaccharide repeat unit polymerase n=1 Tax=Bacteroides sp. 51 TaxID=2302938 RepID=UPI0013D68CCA|nr:oligosaccharide repeat unit polymerase [Bacteroides sp. 51]NDV81533.1 oligosaccharide repeat unit polymerase [Bacteroides sp. 51]
MIKNPASFFVVVWLVVLWLYSQHYVLVLERLSSTTTIFILLSLLCFSLPFFLLFRVKNNPNHSACLSEKVDKRLKGLFKFWACFSVLEILIFRSLPFFSFLGFGGHYTEWGIPSLHGLLNAMIITISNICFYKYLLSKKKKYLYLFLLCLCWPILLLTRQVIMSMIIQAILIYIYINKIKISKILAYFSVFFIVVFLFGLLGDMRSGAGAIAALAGVADNYPSFLPSGFLWVYVYVTSPLNNLNHNIYLYPDFAFSPLTAFANLFPSFVRSKVVPSSDIETSLVNDNLNVVTMHPQYLSAFGFCGALLFYFLYGLFVLYVFVQFKTKINAKWLFMTVVLTHNLLLSVFVDFNFSLVFLFQLFLHYWLGTTFLIKRT